MSNPNKMPTVAIEDGSKGLECMRLWPFIAFVTFGDDRHLVFGLCTG